MGRVQLDEELDRLAAEFDTMSAALLEFEAVPTRRLLEQASLVGVTAQRWAQAQAAVARLWEYFTAYQAAMVHIREVRSRRHRLGPAELDELTELLRGPVVVLGVHDVPLRQRSLTGPATTEERLTLAAAVAAMNADFALANAVVAAVDDVWSVVLGRLDQVEASLAAAAGVASDLDETAIGQATVARFETELADIRQQVLTDPLAITDPATGPHSQRLDRVVKDVEAWRARLEQAVRLRDGFAERVAELQRGLQRLAAVETQARVAIAAARAKILATVEAGWSAQLPVLTSGVAALAERRGGWLNAADEVQSLARDLTAAVVAAEARAAAADALLARRAELRGRLGAYQAKAARLGRAEDPVLDQHFRAARDLLWSAPCDLAAAEAAVTRYQRAIAGTAHIAPRGETPS